MADACLTAANEFVDFLQHKLLRQKRWVLPIPTSGVPTSAAPKLVTGTETRALDIEFENAWETTSDWNEDDEEVVREENELCFPEDSLTSGTTANGHADGRGMMMDISM